MSNIMAAIGLEQLKRFSDISLKRQLLARRYDKLLINNAIFSPIAHDYANVVPHIYVVIIKGLIDRDVLRERMAGAGIQTGIHYKPNHLLSLYEAINISPLKITESIYPKMLTLPLHPDMSESDVDFVCDKLCSYV